MDISPIVILNRALKAVPAVRYAAGVAGVAAVVAIIAGFKIDPKIAVFGTMIVFGLMFVLVVFSAAAAYAGPGLVWLALFSAWCFVLLTIITSSLLMTSYFFTWPRPIDSYIQTNKTREPGTTYIYPSGRFEKQGAVWVEYPPYNEGKNLTFREAKSEGGYIYLYDETRHVENDPVRIFYLRIPIEGGMAQWSFPNPFVWKDLYPVRRQTE
jgi:hypothetical protein